MKSTLGTSQLGRSQLGRPPPGTTGNKNRTDLKRVASQVYHDFFEKRLLLIAAGVAFYALLATFPATAALVSLFGMVADAASLKSNLSLLNGFLPQGAEEIIGDQITRVISQGNKALGVTFFVSLALSLWGANSATAAIFDALNIIYRVDEKRSYPMLIGQAMMFTFLGVLIIIIAVAGVVAAPLFLTRLGLSSDLWVKMLSLLRWPVLLCALLGGLACLYRYGPSRDRPVRWVWITWGSASATVVWLVGSGVYSWYVANFGSFNATYGSLGAAVGFMIWIWLSTTIVLLGAQINAAIESHFQTA